MLACRRVFVLPFSLCVTCVDEFSCSPVGEFSYSPSSFHTPFEFSYSTSSFHTPFEFSYSVRVFILRLSFHTPFEFSYSRSSFHTPVRVFILSSCDFWISCVDS